MAERRLVSEFRRWFQGSAPRKLQITTGGKIIISIAFVIGFAAINTGNNLLFLGWGLILSSIVLSGVLSESTLRVLKLGTETYPLLRAGRSQNLGTKLSNASGSWPAFGLQLEPQWKKSADEPEQVSCRSRESFELRLDQGSTTDIRVRVLPLKRGALELRAWKAATAFPFGFFNKSREIGRDKTLWVAPAKLELNLPTQIILARLGHQPSRQKGRGDEFFSLKPYKEGDDPRHIHWKRSARTGRLVSLEHEAQATRQLVVSVITKGLPSARKELALATLGSFCEELLGAGHKVGLHSEGIFFTPQGGNRALLHILQSLAKHSDQNPLAPLGRLDEAALIKIDAGRGVIATGGTVLTLDELVEPNILRNVLAQAEGKWDGLGSAT